MDKLSRNVESEPVRSKFATFLTWLLITSASPFMFYALSWHPYKIVIIITLFFMALMIFSKKHLKLGENVIIYILLLQFLYSIFCALYYSDFSYVNLAFQFITLFVMYTYVNNFVGINSFAESVVWVLLIMGALGCTAFILAFLGVLPPMGEMVYASGQNERHVYNYLLTFTNVSIEVGGKYFIRVSGYFNEPGAMAYYITQAILLNKLLGGGNKKEGFLVFFGLLTFSLALVASLLIYYILFNSNRLVRKKTLLVGAIFLILPVMIFKNISSGQSQALDVVSEYTVNRLSLTGEDGTVISGDNRTENMKSNIKYFIDNPIMGLGNNGFIELQKNINYRGGSIVDVMIINGLVGVLFYFMHYLYLLYYAISRNSIERADWMPAKIAFILGINYIQRPYVLGVFNYIILLLMIILFIRRFKTGSARVEARG